MPIFLVIVIVIVNYPTLVHTNLIVIAPLTTRLVLMTDKYCNWTRTYYG